MTIVPTFGRPQLAGQNFFQALQQKWANKIGRIESLLQSPCSADTPGGELKNMFLWAAAFFAGVPEAIATLNTHDCSDNMWDKNKDLWRPIGNRGGGRHGRRGTPNNNGGDSLPSSGKQATGWQQGMFNFGNFIERIGAKLMIIDAALDLAINWQTNWLEWTGCGAPPAVFTTATVARDVVGSSFDLLRNDMAGHPGSVGIICGIGGFATTVPVGELQFAGSVADHQFLWTPYEGLHGTPWIVDGIGGNPSPTLDMTQGQAPAVGGVGQTTSSRASMHTLGATGRTGSMWFECPQQEGHGCQIDPGNIVTIMGSNEGLFTNDPKTDPCSNLPLTGTAPTRR